MLMTANLFEPPISAAPHASHCHRVLVTATRQQWLSNKPTVLVVDNGSDVDTGYVCQYLQDLNLRRSNEKVAAHPAEDALH